MKGMTSKELQFVLDYINSLMSVGRATRLEQLEKAKEEREIIHKEIAEVSIAGGNPIEYGVVKENNSWGKKILEWLRELANNIG